MSVTTAPVDFNDLYTDLLNRVHASTSTPAITNIAKRYVNQALLDMHVGHGEKFPWAHRDSLLHTHAPYSTGTLTIIRGFTAALGLNTAWLSMNEFGNLNVRAIGKVRFGGQHETYRVARTPLSDTALHFEDAYAGDVTAGSTYTGTYQYFESEYVLPTDFIRPVDVTRFNNDIELIGRVEFRRRYPDNLRLGEPTIASIVDTTTFPGGTITPDLPRRRIMFHPTPNAVYLLQFSYVTNELVVSSTGVAATQFSANTDEPIVPQEYRSAIVAKALEQWYRDRKDDERSFAAKAEYTEILFGALEGEIAQDHAHIEPRREKRHFRHPKDYYHSQSQRPW